MTEKKSAGGKNKKRFFASHAKSSAALVSLGIHAVLIVIAISFVAVSVITKEDQSFEAKPVNRPKMQLKKLQVPVNVKKKKTQKPKLRKRIVVQPKLNQTMPDIKMPEISGVKGGIGAGAGAGLGGGGGIGFSMPEINLFGVKGKGEKVFIILDSSPWMMYDEIGGIPGYKIIKEELVKILGSLSPTVLFNIAIYDGKAKVLFPDLVSANPANVAKVESWLKPLNGVKSKMGDRDYGLRTLGPGGQSINTKDLTVAPVKSSTDWSGPAFLAMAQNADTVFILTQGWGRLHHTVEAAEQWGPEKMARYKEIQKKARQKLKEENERRRANGQPPRVLVGMAVIKAYFPGTEIPPQPKRHHYSAGEMANALKKKRAASKNKVSLTSGLGGDKRRNKFSVNVIHFVKKSGGSEKDGAQFKQLTQEMHGEYRTLAGLDAIKSSASR